ncbi:hypothetical protein PtA15_2A904 [Puccinia triticina]|uniref:Uncharacterized protein n=1 Tax=Puccinia triticina TaxID=208348 RepID=A0ABY7CIF9_9BASI|nr:uncharacterized protein PtA15_2A904 [Puccinia triticina]WAQ82587.1 hypothetical protein PtA15_2A904 [Puccinia triticina]
MPQSNHPNMRTQSELEEQSLIERDVRIGQRLGQIDADHEPGVWEDINNKQPDHPNYKPPIGSYTDPDWQVDLGNLPSSAHASYHQARRYAEARVRLQNRWMQLEKDATAAFLLCQRKTSNWTYQNRPEAYGT